MHEGASLVVHRQNFVSGRNNPTSYAGYKRAGPSHRDLRPEVRSEGLFSHLNVETFSSNIEQTQSNTLLDARCWMKVFDADHGWQKSP